MSSGKRLLLIKNPVSGKRRSKNIIKMTKAFNSAGFDTTSILTRFSGHAESLIKDNGKYFDMVAVVGGDGTYSEVINGLMNLGNNLPICLIPAGSTNELAKALGINTKASLAEIVETAARNRLSENDIGIINGRYFTYVAAFGLFTDATYTTPQRLKKVLGLGAYVITGLINIRKFKTQKLLVQSKEYTGQGEYIFGSVSNAIAIGNFIKFKKEEILLDDGKFEVLLATKPSSIKNWIKLFSSIASQKYLQNENVISFKTDQIRISSQDPSNQFIWSVDGEAGEPSDVFEIDIQQKAYQVIT